jgi:hypothetical protein
MARYLMLAYETEDMFADIAPEAAQAIIQRYIAWSDGLREAGHMVGGNKLQDGVGRALKGGAGGAVVVRDGPFAETKEVIGGYWLIEAPDWDAVVELARGCPHVEFGTLVIRAIDEV